MYIIYLWGNFWIFSMLTLLPLLGITHFTGTLDMDNLIIKAIALLWVGFIGILSHTSAIHQADEDTDIIEGIKMGFGDLVVYVKLLLKIG